MPAKTKKSKKGSATAKKKSAPKARKSAAPAKKAVSKSSSSRKSPTTAIKDRYTKSQILNTISENTGLTKKEVGIVLEELETLIQRHIKKGASGEFVLPGMFKIVTVKKPARPARWGVNPFTGEKQQFKAKPASIAVKVRPLKKMKEMAS